VITGPFGYGFSDVADPREDTMTNEFDVSEPSEHGDHQVLGHDVVTANGEVIGTVNDVLMDEKADVDTAWAVVSTGRLRADRFVPLSESYRGADGSLVVPYDKNTVKHAPRADEHVLTAPVREKLSAYYGTA
jgi:sporulation protein YlmC with PRC-barrel domain